MGNVYLIPKVRDVDIQKSPISDDCLVLCLTSNISTLEIDEELFFGRMKKVNALSIKNKYKELTSNPIN